MYALTQSEKITFLKLFNRNGYVLDFSTDDFDKFTMESVGIALCEKYRQSKGKSLKEYVLNDAKDQEVIKIFKDLLEYYKENYSQEYKKDADKEVSGYLQYNAEYASLYQKCQEYMNRVTNAISPFFANVVKLQESFSSEYLSKQIEIMMEMRTESPMDAIGKAKELIESYCKTILKKKGVTWNKNWDIGKLTRETLSILNLTPESIPNTGPAAKNIKAILGNLSGITQKLAEIRNLYGSGHGKEASFTGLEIRHANLAIGCSTAFVKFLLDTYEGENQNEV